MKRDYDTGDRRVPPEHYPDISIIEVLEENGEMIVQLRATFNADAECCYEDEDGNERTHTSFDDDQTVIQAEEYHSGGWHCRRDDPRLLTAEGFWQLWDDWNASVCGGIYLYDDNTVADIRYDLKTKKHVFYDEIKDLPPGEYVVIGKREDYEKKEEK